MMLINKMDNHREFLNLKTTFFGASVTGKTCIITRIKDDVFQPESCTIGVSFTKLVKDGVNYSIWDTRGQERFHSLLPMYFRGSSILIFVFDLSDEKSMMNIDKYINQLIDLTDCCIIIVGNKSDLVDTGTINEIDQKIRTKLSSSNISDKIYGYVYMSALNGEGVTGLFKAMADCAKLIEPLKNKKPRELDMPINFNEPQVEYGCYC